MAKSPYSMLRSSTVCCTSSIIRLNPHGWCWTPKSIKIPIIMLVIHSIKVDTSFHEVLIINEVSVGTSFHLLGGIPTPLKNMSSSVGMMTFPIFLESHKSHVPVTTNQPWKNPIISSHFRIKKPRVSQVQPLSPQKHLWNPFTSVTSLRRSRPAKFEAWV